LFAVSHADFEKSDESRKKEFQNFRKSKIRTLQFMPHHDEPDFHNAPCPWLPAVEEIHDFTLTRKHGSGRGPEFYLDALRYAQSQWMARKPAQALLQLNKAWMADLQRQERILLEHPAPYRALAWILRRAAAGKHGYLGNPVRHFQHLASRMSGPRAEIRAWRAWLCMHLAGRVLPCGMHPRDGRQIAREGLWIPTAGRALDAVRDLGWQGEWLAARDAMAEISPGSPICPQLQSVRGVKTPDLTPS
jgi:hypothetical protein